MEAVKQQRIIDFDESMRGILVCCPAYGQTMTAHTGGLFYSLAQMLTAAGIPNQFLWFSMADIIEVRNIFITKFYDEFPGYSHFLTIDADMHVSPFLIRDMIQFRKPLIGVVYSRRESPMSSIGHELGPDQPIYNGFQQWKHIGGGVMLIERRVVTEILKKFPETNDCTDPGNLRKTGVTRIIRAFDRTHDEIGSHLSEDFSFCERWRRCGGEIWASVDSPIGHIGPFNYAFQWTRRAEIFGSQPQQVMA